MTVVTVDRVVAAYMKLRDQKAALKAKFDEDVGTIETKMQKLEHWIKIGRAHV